MVFYLYDDVNQLDGAWYKHLEEKDIKDNTIISSIKVCFSQKGTTITSQITLTVFIHNGDEDFDEYGHYRGNSKYTVTINHN